MSFKFKQAFSDHVIGFTFPLLKYYCLDLILHTNAPSSALHIGSIDRFSLILIKLILAIINHDGFIIMFIA